METEQYSFFDRYIGPLLLLIAMLVVFATVVKVVYDVFKWVWGI